LGVEGGGIAASIEERRPIKMVTPFSTEFTVEVERRVVEAKNLGSLVRNGVV